jgi:hypothetical protein
MLHNSLIAIHATSAVVALLPGAFALRPPSQVIPAFFRL